MDKRKGLDPVPYNIRAYLNDTQQYELTRLEAFGWQVCFVRRPPGEAPTVVITNSNETDWAELNEDGNMRRDNALQYRTEQEEADVVWPQADELCEPTYAKVDSADDGTEIDSNASEHPADTDAPTETRVLVKIKSNDDNNSAAAAPTERKQDRRQEQRRESPAHQKDKTFVAPGVKFLV